MAHEVDSVCFPQPLADEKIIGYCYSSSSFLKNSG
jgi:hypothetical protein